MSDLVALVGLSTVCSHPGRFVGADVLLRV